MQNRRAIFGAAVLTNCGLAPLIQSSSNSERADALLQNELARMMTKTNLKTVAGTGFSAAFVAGSFLLVCFGASERDSAWLWVLIPLAFWVFPVAFGIGFVALLLSFFWRE